MLNRCGRSQDYISGQPQQALNRARAQSKPSKKLPWPVKYLHDREACDYITEYIWQKYLESGWKKGKLDVTEEFKPDDWPGYIWPFTSIKKAFQRYKDSKIQALGFHKKKVEVLKDIIIHLFQAEDLDAILSEQC